MVRDFLGDQPLSVEARNQEIFGDGCLTPKLTKRNLEADTKYSLDFDVGLGRSLLTANSEQSLDLMPILGQAVHYRLFRFPDVRDIKMCLWPLVIIGMGCCWLWRLRGW